MEYLCYDLKGIQSFIFSIPRLRYIIGGSALLDTFDKKVHELERPADVRYLFSGGGRGAFACDNSAGLDAIQRTLIKNAGDIGADIAVGRNADYSEAAHCATQLYPCLPSGDELDGGPCRESGLYPVSDATRQHRLVRGRLYRRGEKIFRHYEKDFLPRLTIPPMLGEGSEVDFFHDVSPEVDEPGEDIDPDAFAGAASLSKRNRWAIICMDGNDMGAQFRHRHEDHPDTETMIKWLKTSSKALDSATRGACVDGLQRVINLWCGEVTEDDIADASVHSPEGDIVYLPVRPLLVGGDDVVVLCHVSYAFDFIREVCRSFAARASLENEKWKEEHREQLWGGTNGALTISAGVLFAPVSLPLATAIPYAESLLASAKNKGRQCVEGEEEGKPAPACIDWESVTAGVIDHPALSRQRQYRFLDKDLKVDGENNGAIIELTRRPYTLDALGQRDDDPESKDTLEALVKRYESIPPTIMHQVFPAMSAGYHDRQVWLARLGKRQQGLVTDLSEPFNLKEAKKYKGRWAVIDDGPKGKRRVTDVLDAIDLLVERTRMIRDTVEG